MGNSIRWGILGTGNIAKQFARGLAVIPDAELHAVGSRSQTTADAFADEFKAPRRHASYEALANDPEVDVVYVSTPHQLHKDNSILCLRAGKAVLCEKPFTINAREAEALVSVARETGRFLMEAMWTRFLPIHAKVREWIAAGEIGEVRMVTGDFGFRSSVDSESRLYNPAYGGGALLDIGVYPLSYACMVFGATPDRIASLADLGETGVDEQAGIVLGFGPGRMAVVHAAIRTTTAQEARILGTDGAIYLHPPFWKGTQATITRSGRKPETVELPYEGNGYNCQAVHVMDCLRSGKTESPVMPLDESIAIMRTMDRVREQWGLKYPME